MTGHSYFGNIDPAFSQEFSVQPNFKQPDSSKKLFPEYMGIPILVPIELEEIFPENFSATKIHRESYSHTIVHTVTVSHDSVFFTTFSHDCVASETT